MTGRRSRRSRRRPAGRFRLGEVDGGVGELGEHGVDRFGFGLAVVAVDGLDDLLAQGEDRREMSLLRMNWSFSTRVEVGGVADDDLEGPALLSQGQDDVFARHRLGHQLDDGRRNGDVGEIDELHAVELGDGGHHLLVGGVAELDQGVGQFGPGLLRDALRFLELVGAEDLLANQDLREVTARLGHESTLQRNRGTEGGRRGATGSAAWGEGERNIFRDRIGQPGQRVSGYAFQNKENDRRNQGKTAPARPGGAVLECGVSTPLSFSSAADEKKAALKRRRAA